MTKLQPVDSRVFMDMTKLQPGDSRVFMGKLHRGDGRPDLRKTTTESRPHFFTVLLVLISHVHIVSPLAKAHHSLKTALKIIILVLSLITERFHCCVAATVDFAKGGQMKCSTKGGQ